MNTLREVINEIEVEEQEVSFQPFTVTDLESAAEAQRRIAYFRDQMENIDKIVEQQIKPFMDKIEKIKDWGEQAKKEFHDKESSYAAHLEMFMREEIRKQVESGKKPKKTISLPYGKISLKKQQPEFAKDEDVLLNYAKQVGLYKTKESTDWSELKKKCEVVNGYLVDKETGEVIPGVTVTERDDKFELKMD
jgi:hypothetical protein